MSYRSGSSHRGGSKAEAKIANNYTNNTTTTTTSTGTNINTTTSTRSMSTTTPTTTAMSSTMSNSSAPPIDRYSSAPAASSSYTTTSSHSRASSSSRSPSSSSPTPTSPSRRSSVEIPSTQQHDYLFKLLLIGDSGVGKSCLLRRFTDRTFSESSVFTIGVDFKFRSMMIRGKVVRLQLWDTAGQERFRTLTSSFYRGAQGILLVYDTQCRESFDSIQTRWLPEIDLHGETGINRILVANKSDMPARQVSTAEGEALAAKLGVHFMETSAKTADNVESAFLSMASDMFRRIAAPTLELQRAVSHPDDALEDDIEDDAVLGGTDGYVVVDRPTGIVDLSSGGLAPANAKDRRTKNIAGNMLSRRCCH